MKKLYYTSLILILPVALMAQHPEIKRTNHWFFGWNAGLDFSSGTVVPDTNGAYDNYEAAATISDTAGNLLFYTDAETVWNRNHQTMLNGIDIGGCSGSTQGALIVPEPQNDSIYYIFTTDCTENNLLKGLRYSIVNMSLDSGRGAVTQKDILLHTLVTEKLAGIYHTNGTDVWVVAHEWNSNNFLAYLLTAQGIDTVPVISSTGSIHNGLTYNEDAGGYMKISPNGKKIACVKYTNNVVELFDFDNTTGAIINPIVLATVMNIWAYGASFSPDNSMLYISYQYDQAITLGGRLYQFNLLAGSAADIISSKMLIYSSTNYHFHTLQNGKDGKIYLAEANFQTNDGGVLGIINNPNKLGLSCSFAQFGISLVGKRSRWGLPNFIESYFNCDTCKVDTSGVGVSEQLYNVDKVFIFPNPATDELYIQSSDEILSLSIKNIQGISFHKDEFLYPEKNLQIDVSYLSNGLYMIYLKTKYRTYTSKLVKIKK